MNAKLLLTAVLAASGLVGLGQPQEPAPTLIVMGAAGDVNDARWNNYRLGIAIRDLITEGLFDNYLLLEEKPALFRRKEALAKRAWRQNGGTYDFRDDLVAFGSTGADFLAYAHISLTAVPWQYGRHGMAGSRKLRVNVEVSITIVETLTGEELTGHGYGMADATLENAGFAIRNRIVHFGESTLGLATRGAIRNALKAMVPMPVGI